MMKCPRRPLRAAILCVLPLLMLAFGPPAVAQWQWKDATGRVHFSDRPPPPDIPESSVLRRPAAAAAPRPAATPAQDAAAAQGQEAAPAREAAEKPSAPPTVDKELEARRQKEEQEALAKRKAEEERIAKARAENCARARSHQQTLDSGVRIARTNAQGEREILDDKGRAEEAARTRRIIESDCK